MRGHPLPDAGAFRSIHILTSAPPTGSRSMLSFKTALREHGPGADFGARVWHLEPLEPRALLSPTPFPTLDQLEDPADRVARIETTLGTIDIELFASAAPATLAQFLADLFA